MSNGDIVTDIPLQNRLFIEEVTLTTPTLLNVLNFIRAPSVIDYFNLDIEGAEYYAMKHFDFGSYTFLMMSVERPKKELHHLLVKHGYWLLTTGDPSGCAFGDMLYVHDSIPNFHSLMVEYNESRYKSWEEYVFHPVYSLETYNKRKSSGKSFRI